MVLPSKCILPIKSEEQFNMTVSFLMTAGYHWYTCNVSWASFKRRCSKYLLIGLFDDPEGITTGSYSLRYYQHFTEGAPIINLTFEDDEP